MSAQRPCYQVIHQRITAALPRAIPAASITRLALLVTGILAAKSAVLAQIAAELDALALTRATTPDSIGRRLRRTLQDGHLDQATCYTPVLRHVLDWDEVLRGQRRVVLIVDESSKADDLHLFRIALPYWGGSLPLAWCVWQQNVALPSGYYWTAVEQVLAQVAALLPAGLEVVVVADRASAIAPFIDRLRSYGWQWVLRLTTSGSHRWCDRHGREQALRTVLAQHLAQPGQRWHTRGRRFKDAGWRQVNLVGRWAVGYQEALVLITNLGERWSVVALYQRRFWIEPGFRSDTRTGWQWEASQVRGVAQHERLLVGMAWASLVALVVGVEAAAAAVARLAAQRRRRPRPQARQARESVFTLGLRALRHWLYQATHCALHGQLSQLDAPSWEQQWYQHQSLRLIFGSPVRP
jgi:Transposase DDE domain